MEKEIQKLKSELDDVRINIFIFPLNYECFQEFKTLLHIVLHIFILKERRRAEQLEEMKRNADSRLDIYEKR